MFPKTDNLRIFKPKSIYGTTGAGLLQKLGKSTIKTVSRIIKKKIGNRKSTKKSTKKQSSGKKKKKKNNKNTGKKKKPSTTSNKRPTRDIFS